MIGISTANKKGYEVSLMAAIRSLDCEVQDNVGSLVGFKGRLVLLDGDQYLDGASLGQVSFLRTREWGQHLIFGLLADGWMAKPLVLGDKVARLIGVAPGKVAAVDTTSINVFRLLASALRIRLYRVVILSNRESFPTDFDMTQGLGD